MAISRKAVVRHEVLHQRNQNLGSFYERQTDQRSNLI